MLLYLKVVLLIVLAALSGVLIPEFLSAPSDIEYGLGFVLGLVTPPALFVVARWIVSDPLFKQLLARLTGLVPVLLAVALTPMFGGCGLVGVEYWRVPAGQVLVVVNKYGAEKGVDVETRGPGRYWLNWNQEGHLFPTFTQNYTWTKDCIDGDCADESISFQSNKGMVVNTDVGISYAIQADKAGLVFAKYRKGIDEITDVFLRNMVRDALVRGASSMSVEAIYGEGKTKLLAGVEEEVRAQVAPIGILVENLYWIGAARLPPVVVEALNASIQATQIAVQRENEVQATKAEAEKAREKAKGEADAILTRAKAEAEANKLVSQSLTAELVKYRALDKWTGELPRINGAGALPFVDVSADAK